MAEGKASKRENRVLAIAIGVAVLTVAVYVGYLKVPRHISGLCPEIWQADLCSALYRDEALEATSVNFEGEALEALIGKLDSLPLYPLPGRRSLDGSVTLKGYAVWDFYFRINGENAKVSIIVTDRGEVSVGKRVFETRTEDLEALLKGISAE